MGQRREYATVGVADLSLLAGLVRAAAGVAAVLGSVAVMDAAGGGPHRWALAAGSVAASAAVGGIAVRHRLRPFRASSAGHLAGVAGVLVALNSLNHIALTGDPLTSTYLMLTLVGAGAIFTMARWLLVVDAVALAGFAPLAAGRLAEPAWRHFALMLLICVAMAHVLQHLRAQGQAELQRLTEALAAQARRDHLTELHNRHGLADLVPSLTGPGSTVGVLCIDVDGFKRINDELGHAAGDAVLVEIAERLRAATPDGACAVRLGGDEFAVLAPGAGARVVAALAREVRESLAGTAGVLGLPWSVSVGTATGPAEEPHDVERLLATADLAMYDDKQRRRAPVRLAAPAQEAPAASA